MISAQNHRPLLSGNKPVLFVLIFLLLQSCGLFNLPDKSGSKDPEFGIEKNESPDLTVEENTKPDIERPSEEDTLAGVYPLVLKDYYNIVLFMPLFLDREMQENKGVQRISRIAQDYLLGFEKAVDTIITCGGKYHIRVVDTRADSFKVSFALDTMNPDSIDLIIGPFSKKCIGVLSKYSQEHQIPMFSPFQSRRDLLRENPYFIAAEPNQKVLANNLAQILNSKYQHTPIFIIRQDTLPSEEFVKELRKKLQKEKFTIIEDFKTTEKGSLRIGKYLERPILDGSIVIIPGNNKGFISNVLSYFRRQEKLDSVTLFGTGTMMEFENIDDQFMGKYRTHFLTDYYVNYEDIQVQKFVKTYRSEYNMEPSSFNIEGYDAGLFTLINQHNYGKYFQRGLYFTSFEALHNKYLFNRAGKGGWYILNSHLLRYHNYKIEPVKLN